MDRYNETFLQHENVLPYFHQAHSAIFIPGIATSTTSTAETSQHKTRPECVGK